MMMMMRWEIEKIFHYFFSIKLVDFISTLNICTDRDLCHTYIFLVVVVVVCSLFDPFKIMPDLFIHSFIHFWSIIMMIEQ